MKYWIWKWRKLFIAVHRYEHAAGIGLYLGYQRSNYVKDDMKVSVGIDLGAYNVEVGYTNY